MVILNRYELGSRRKNIPLIDLRAQQTRIRDGVDRAIQRVLDHGQYIMGPEVAELEEQLAAFAGTRHAVSVSSGTDALTAVLMAKGIGPGDAVICPDFTYPATPECIALLGATPIFSDVCYDTFNLDPAGLPGAVKTARLAGFVPRAVIVADLFGLPADYENILRVAEINDLFVISDAAQSFGARYCDKRAGNFGIAATTSFFPAKPLGCYGDGGAVLTDDDALADLIRSIRLHGKGERKYDIVRVGINGRLDTLQAAILLEKLAIFEDEIERRCMIAERYAQMFGQAILTPKVPAGRLSVWAQYTLRLLNGQRDVVAAALANKDISSAVYYPRPLSKQPAYQHFPVSKTGVSIAARLALEVLSLPMHPYLDEATQEEIVTAVQTTLA